MAGPQDNGTMAISPYQVHAINATARDWRVEPLPSILTFVNGSLTTTYTNGTPYSGNIPNGTASIELVQSTTVGGVPMLRFIYLMISIIVILVLLVCSLEWVLAFNEKQPHRWYSENLGYICAWRYTPVALVTAGITPGAFRHELLNRYPPEPDVAPLPSYIESALRKPGDPITPEEPRRCRQLIREKYAMDVEIYNLRDVLASDRPSREAKKSQSNGAIEDIRRTVGSWMRTPNDWSAEEWEYIQEINRIIGTVKPWKEQRN